jgi:membrane protein YdbS with pleckstrin-like domain
MLKNQIMKMRSKEVVVLISIIAIQFTFLYFFGMLDSWLSLIEKLITPAIFIVAIASIVLLFLYATYEFKLKLFDEVNENKQGEKNNDKL